MDSLRFCLALGPLALYLLLIGVVNLSRRSFVVTGARDLAALGVGVAGLVVVGPIELLLPQNAAMQFGPYLWLMLLVMYSLLLSIAVMLARPRLVIYNASASELRPVLAEVIESLDADARWAGNSLVMPRLQIELHVDGGGSLRTVSLVASSDDQSYSGWQKLEATLVDALKPIKRPANAWGVGLVFVSLAVLISMAYELTMHPQEITEAFQEMLRLQ
jgi:hypothetical protein